jgi:hypothetical protein
MVGVVKPSLLSADLLVNYERAVAESKSTS